MRDDDTGLSLGRLEATVGGNARNEKVRRRGQGGEGAKRQLDMREISNSG